MRLLPAVSRRER